MTFESWMNFRVGIAIGALMMLVLFAIAYWLKEKDWKKRVGLAKEKAKRELEAELAELPVYRAKEVSLCSEPLIKTWFRASSAEDIAWMCDWIYIVNMAAFVADEEPDWRLMLVDYLGQAETAKLAQEIRESDKSKEAIYVAVKRAFNWSYAFSNYPFENMDWMKIDQLVGAPKCPKTK